MSLNDFILGASSSGGATGGASGSPARPPSEEVDAVVRRTDDTPASVQLDDLERGAGSLAAAASPEEEGGLKFSDFETGVGLRTSSPIGDKDVQKGSISECFQSSDQLSDLRKRSERSVRPKVRSRPSMIVLPQIQEMVEFGFSPEDRERREEFQPEVREMSDMSSRSLDQEINLSHETAVRERGGMSYRPAVLDSSEVCDRPRVRERSKLRASQREISRLESLLTGAPANDDDNEIAVKRRRVHFGSYLPTITDEEEMAHSVEDVNEMKPLFVSCGQEVGPFTYGGDQNQNEHYNNNNNSVQEPLAFSGNLSFQQQVAQAINSTPGEQSEPNNNNNSGVQEPLALSGNWSFQQKVAQASNSTTGEPLALVSESRHEQVPPGNFDGQLGTEGDDGDQIPPSSDTEEVVGDGPWPSADQDDSSGAEYQENLDNFLSDVEARFAELYYEGRKGQ